MRFATWNVNSIRARIDRVTAWLERHDVDVLAMQETKCKDEQFPYEALQAAGYQVAHHGISQWNGVAIASRVGLEDVQTGFDGMPTWGDPAVEEARAIRASCDGVQIWSLYVPNGRALDDPHLPYKLTWLAALRDNAKQILEADPTAQFAMVGDWNVAPLDEDVWDLAAFEGSTHVSAEERAAFQAMLDTGLVEVSRPHTPGPGVYTYWDYQQLRFQKRQGMRIDFTLNSPELAARVKSAFIDREERKGKGASDHAPVVVDID